MLRHTIEGTAGQVRRITVTFNQPMVEVSSLEKVADQVPVRLSPEPPGRWTWLDARTVAFDPAATRLAMATAYRLEVPAGVRSALGSTLALPVHWNFATGAPRLTRVSPCGQFESMYPAMLARFNQKIDPQKVRAGIRLQVAGQDLPVRPAFWFDLWWSSPNWAYSLQAEPDTSIAFVPLWPLPRGERVQVVIPAGTPSEEGPRTSATAQGFRFRTAGPLRLVDSERMRRARDKTSPCGTMRLQFTNPLTGAENAEAAVTISPAVPHLKVEVLGASLTLRGSFRPLTAYTVTVAPSLTDQCGNDLDEAVSLGFRTTAATLPPQVDLPQGSFALLEPQRHPEILVRTVNVSRLKVTLYRATSADWGDFCRSMATWSSDPDVVESGPPSTPWFTGTTRGSGDSPWFQQRRLQYLDVAVRPGADRSVETRIPLGSVLQDGTGQVVAMVEPAQWNARGPRPRKITWCQFSRIRVQALVDRARVILWATSSQDGSPLRGVRLTLGSGALPVRGTTDAHGMARLSLPTGSSRRSLDGLMAQKGSDLLFVAESGSRMFDLWGNRSPRSFPGRLHMFSDRGVYRPGEVIHLKGWARNIAPTATAGPTALKSQVKGFTYRLYDSESTMILKGRVRPGPLGSFHLTLPLPTRMRLGDATVGVAVEGMDGRVATMESIHTIKIEEYRTPEFEVKAAAVRPGPFFGGDPADIAVRASYLAGGPLPGARVNWEVNAEPASFTPPGWEDFHFSPAPEDGQSIPGTPWTLEGRTATNGRHVLGIRCDAESLSESVTLSAEATVTDANRRTWTSTETVLVHPSSLFTGLTSTRPFVNRGETIELDSITTDVDGHPVAGRTVNLKGRRVEWKPDTGDWERVEVPLSETILTSGSGRIRHAIPATKAGEYHFVASVRDDRGRIHRSHHTVHVAGDGSSSRAIRPGMPLKLVADQAGYAPGQVARVLVKAPFAPAEGMMSVRRAGVLSVQRFHLAGPSHILEIPITRQFEGGVTVRVDLVGTARMVTTLNRGTGTSKRTAHEATTRRTVHIDELLQLPVSPRAHRLGVKVTPSRAVVEPGEQASLEVQLRDHAGRPVQGGDVAVAVVDEAALALTGYTLDDPLKTFYRMVEDMTCDWSVSTAPLDDSVARFGNYDNVVGSNVSLGGGPGGNPFTGLIGPSGRVNGIGSTSDVRPIVPNLRGYDSSRSLNHSYAGLVAAAGEAPGKRCPPRQMLPPAPVTRTGSVASVDRVRLRSNFKPLAVFVASVRTDANGRGTVRFRMPDNLTRYRIMAVAAEGVTRFGMAESSITARLPLMVRPSAPRFLNTGDRFEFPVTLQNQTDRAMGVDVAVRAANVRFLAPEDASTSTPVEPARSSASPSPATAAVPTGEPTTVPSASPAPAPPTSTADAVVNSTPARRLAGASTSGLSSPADEVASSAGRHLTVPARGRVEVRFPASPSGSGTATFQVAVASSGRSDAAMVSLPVHVPATTEAFATNGVLDGGAVLQPVAAPQGAFPGYGGLEITTSSTQLQALTDALSYLQSYPFDCNEQLASKILSAAALRDVMTAFRVHGMQSAPEMAQAMDKALALLASRQHANGGFGYWAATEGPVDPYLSVHVAHALQRAREKGFKVPAVMLQNARSYLKGIERDIPKRCGRSGRASIMAYALYVRHRLKEPNLAPLALGLVEGRRPGKARKGNPIQEQSTGASPGVPPHLTTEAIGWILPVLHADRKTRPVANRLYQHLLGQVTETGREAHFTDSYGDDAPWMLYSDHRADAVLLESLLTVDPTSDLVPKLVQGLLSHQTQGRWMSTQENVFALLALDRYFHRFESRSPDFAARVWVGEKLAGTQRFVGHSTRRQSLHIPMPALVQALAKHAPAQDQKTAAKGDTSPVGVTLEKSGTGRLYYRLALRYAPRTLTVGPADHGFTVEREYESVEKSQDVRRDEAGVWHVKAGALVRVHIRMNTRAQRHHVALVDPLPAGLEIVNPSLAGNQDLPEDGIVRSRDAYRNMIASGGWFEHQDLRDDRAQAFTRLLWEGDFEYSYVARASTLGTFVVPPPKAEEMYSPEVFGRGSSDRLVVE